MTLKSPAFENNQPIPSKYTCDGTDVNPPLTFSDIPYGTKSLVLIVDDPDSPSKDFTHWIVFNIEPYSTGFPENYTSSNITLGKNDFGKSAYGGPCPNTGEHRYVFKLYALNTILLLQEGASKAEVLSNIQGYVIEQAELIGLYKRQ